ncbi:MAG: SAF domain-containing protein [Actinobacteria bacterium]|nr:SAF domain-containing protein [Actinomycetota bacterium]
MMLLPRLRLALARRPWLYWLFVAGCAVVVWSLLASGQAKLARQRREWGETRRVWIAVGDIARGAQLRTSAGDFPVAMLPPSAVTDDPAGSIADRSIANGEVIVATDVSGGDGDLPADWVVFAVSRNRTPAVHAGDGVALFAGGQYLCDGAVVALADNSLDIGVPPACADATSVQVAADALVLAARKAFRP